MIEGSGNLKNHGIANKCSEIEKQLFNELAYSQKEPEICLSEIKRWDYGTPDLYLVEEALKIRRIFEDTPSGWHVDEPLEDVYQAALNMVRFSSWKEKELRLRVYRGQRSIDFKFKLLRVFICSN